jgi:hypothetical protein
MYECTYQNNYQELTLEHELSIPELNLLNPAERLKKLTHYIN